jgi:hypothetical protein
MNYKMKFLMKIVLFSGLLWLAACGGPEGSGPLIAAPSAGDYANVYTGTVTGTTDASDSGTVSLTIDSDGNINGTATIKNVYYPLVGTVDAAGNVAVNLFASNQVAEIWTGSVTKSTGKMSGTWRYAWSTSTGNDGTFSAIKS